MLKTICFSVNVPRGTYLANLLRKFILIREQFQIREFCTFVEKFSCVESFRVGMFVVEIVTPKLYFLNKSEIIALGAVGLIVAVLYSKANAAGTLLFRPGRVSNIYFDGAAPVIELTLAVQNTSSTGFVLESMAGNILSDNYIIGNFSNFTPINIAANNETVIPLRIRLGLFGLVQDLISAFTTGTFTRRVRLQGFVNAGFVRAPLDVAFEIGSGLNRAQ